MGRMTPVRGRRLGALACVGLVVLACTKPRFFNPIVVAPPPPHTVSVSGVSPDQGATGGGTAILISGSGFTPGAVVLLGGVPCPSVSFVSPSQLSCLTPAHALGDVSLSVTCPDGVSGKFAGGFDYLSNTVSALENPLQLTTGLNVQALVSAPGVFSATQSSAQVLAKVAVLYQP